MGASRSTGSIPAMTTRRLLLALPAVAAVALLPACGSDDDVRGAATSGTAGGPSSASNASAPAVDGGSSAAAALQLQDQTGDGATVQVASVTAVEDGFVVVTLDDDQAGPGQLLGSAEVPAGTSTDVRVDLDTPVPPATGDDDGTEITATLVADTNANGSYDEGTDQAVPEPQDDDDDDDDAVDDDADYRLA